MELWHEQRRRIKQALAAKNQAHATNAIKTRPIKDTTKANESETKADDKKTRSEHLDQEKTEKPEKDLGIKYSVGEKRAAMMGKEVKLEDVDDDDDDEYVMIKIDDTSPNKTVTEFVPISLREREAVTSTAASSAPKNIEDAKQDDSRAKEVNKRIASMLHANKDLESEIMLTGRKEAWVENKRERLSPEQKKSLPDEKGIEPEEKRAVKEEEVVSTRSVSVDTTQKRTDEMIKGEKQEESIKGTGSKEKESKPSVKDNQQKILNEKMKAKKLRIQHRLESVKRERESRTVGGRVCIAAPETPIVFDLVSNSDR